MKKYIFSVLVLSIITWAGLLIQKTEASSICNLNSVSQFSQTRCGCGNNDSLVVVGNSLAQAINAGISVTKTCSNNRFTATIAPTGLTITQKTNCGKSVPIGSQNCAAFQIPVGSNINNPNFDLNVTARMAWIQSPITIKNLTIDVPNKLGLKGKTKLDRVGGGFKKIGKNLLNSTLQNATGGIVQVPMGDGAGTARFYVRPDGGPIVAINATYGSLGTSNDDAGGGILFSDGSDISAAGNVILKAGNAIYFSNITITTLGKAITIMADDLIGGGNIFNQSAQNQAGAAGPISITMPYTSFITNKIGEGIEVGNISAVGRDGNGGAVTLGGAAIIVGTVNTSSLKTGNDGVVGLAAGPIQIRGGKVGAKPDTFQATGLISRGFPPQSITVDVNQMINISGGIDVSGGCKAVTRDSYGRKVCSPHSQAGNITLLSAGVSDNVNHGGISFAPSTRIVANALSSIMDGGSQVKGEGIAGTVNIQASNGAIQLNGAAISANGFRSTANAVTVMGRDISLSGMIDASNKDIDAKPTVVGSTAGNITVSASGTMNILDGTTLLTNAESPFVKKGGNITVSAGTMTFTTSTIFTMKANGAMNTVPPSQPWYGSITGGAGGEIKLASSNPGILGPGTLAFYAKGGYGSQGGARGAGGKIIFSTNITCSSTIPPDAVDPALLNDGTHVIGVNSSCKPGSMGFFANPLSFAYDFIKLSLKESIASMMRTFGIIGSSTPRIVSVSLPTCGNNIAERGEQCCEPGLPCPADSNPLSFCFNCRIISQLFDNAPVPTPTSTPTSTPTPTPTPTPAPSCTDTDGGMIYTTRGTATGKDPATGSTISRTDYCTGGALDLKEYYCSGSYLYSRTYTCSSTCSNGACPTPTPTPTTSVTPTPCPIVPNTTGTDTLSDLFNRANSSNIGSCWDEMLGNAAIADNRAVSTVAGTASNFSVALLKTSVLSNTRDASLTAKLNPSTSLDFQEGAAGLVARYQDSNNYYYAVVYGNFDATSPGHIEIIAKVNGNLIGLGGAQLSSRGSGLGTLSVTCASNCSGTGVPTSTITLKWNGLIVKTVSDTRLPNAGRWGFLVMTSDGNQTRSYLDDFIISR